MSKKLKLIAIALGVASLLVVSFAGVALAAGPASPGNQTSDCIQLRDQLQECDPVKDQTQDCIQLRDQSQDCDPIKDQTQDRIQLKDKSQDCVK